MAIRLLLADDHELLRLGFQTMLRKIPGLEVVGEAEDGKELLEKALLLEPDVVITDINMPRMDGIAAARQLTVLRPKIPIIALTMFDEDSLLIDMLEAGARGYIIKNTGKDEVLLAIQTVLEGKPYYCNKTSARLATLIANSQFNPYKKKETPLFTEKEVEIIVLLCNECSNKDISEQTGLSQRTVESYRERLFTKMQVRNLAGLVVYAIKNGLYKI